MVVSSLTNAVNTVGPMPDRIGTATHICAPLPDDPCGLAGGPTFLKIDLDRVAHNVMCIRRIIGEKKGIIAVLKAFVFSVGGAPMANFLKKIGVDRIAVAYPCEGEDLRKNGVTGPIYTLGSASVYEIPILFENELIPSVSTRQFIIEWADYLNRNLPKITTGITISDLKRSELRRWNPADQDKKFGSIAIKIDTGLGRHGFQPTEINQVVELCDQLDVPIDSFYTHFAQSWTNPAYTECQLNDFLAATEPFRNSPSKFYHFHIANSPAIVRRMGVDGSFDLVRCSGLIYGAYVDANRLDPVWLDAGFLPTVSWLAKPVFVKTTDSADMKRMATFPVGYLDGFPAQLPPDHSYIRDSDGRYCPVVSAVGPDATTVRLPDQTDLDQLFQIMSADYDPDTSAYGWSCRLARLAIPRLTRFSERLPKLYCLTGHKTVVVKTLSVF